MEILNPTIPTHPQIFFRAKVFSIKFPITNYRNKPNFKFPLYPLPPFKFSISSTRNFRVAAHFGKSTNRRNSLRKKLIEQHQVRQNPTIYNPSSNFENPDGVHNSVSNSDNDIITDSVEVSKSNSGLWNQLESWVDQYKADSEFWGIGSSPIFTVFQNSDGKVVKVSVNEDEILRRRQIEPSLYKLKEYEDIKEVNLKISHAKFLAREMENGNNVLPKNSSVAKFVGSGGQSGFVNSIRGFTFEPGMVSKVSKVGISVLCGFFVFLALKRLFFTTGEEQDRKEEYSSLEKEMLRRKIKARMEKEKWVKGSVEVIQDSKEPEIVFTERPQLDKQELMNNIVKVEVSNDKLMPNVSLDSNSVDFDHKIEEIRTMARHAREIERVDPLPSDNSVREDNQMAKDDSKFLNGSNRVKKSNIGNSDILEVEVPDDSKSITQVVEGRNYVSNLLDTEKMSQLSETPDTKSKMPEKNSVRAKPRIIKSVKEAREYLSQKHDKREQHQETEVKTVQEVDSNVNIGNEREIGQKISQQFGNNGKMSDLSISIRRSDFSRNESSEDTDLEEKDTFPTKNCDSEDGEEGYGVIDNQVPMTSIDQGSSDGMAGELQSVNQENWLERNFHEFEPIVDKIRVGFRDNYNVAREEVKEDANIVSELIQPKPDEDDGELDWMKDDKLREIVFQVRENELMGRDPFYLMDPEDKLVFFEGLEKKVEKENEKLLNLHQFVHSNIENLDYGADGISLHDPPEKIIPRWKGPPPATTTSPEFLTDYLEQRKTLFAENFGNSNLVRRDEQNLVQKSKESPSHDNTAVYTRNEKLKGPKTVIEGSDGSVRDGKKSGKEFWQHTKKWSRGFLESYNAETDPEIKAEMKNIGKDLDRWITEKEIQDAANLMNKIPEKGQKFIQEKLNKVKREMELFGPQAVVSKYSEYGEEKEEDYFWWLDLPFVLCIELYLDGDGDQRIGFYSLEMAADLEIEPKPHHVIAFEDASDCKNFCYIIQAHMEMIGNGNAFVVAQSPKDTYREAKSNGFNVTVIRKGELQLNVDQTLEEVEEEITEIGSKMYHDKIMQGRNVDISSLMKGVFGVKKPMRRKRSKRKLKKPT